MGLFSKRKSKKKDKTGGTSQGNNNGSINQLQPNGAVSMGNMSTLSGMSSGGSFHQTQSQQNLQMAQSQSNINLNQPGLAATMVDSSMLNRMSGVSGIAGLERMGGINSSEPIASSGSIPTSSGSISAGKGNKSARNAFVPPPPPSPQPAAVPTTATPNSDIPVSSGGRSGTHKTMNSDSTTKSTPPPPPPVTTPPPPPNDGGNVIISPTIGEHPPLPPKPSKEVLNQATEEPISEDQVREVLTTFYQIYEPSKIATMDKIMEYVRQKGYTRLDKGLLRKYGCCTGLAKLPGVNTIDTGLSTTQNKDIQEQEEQSNNDIQKEEQVNHPIQKEEEQENNDIQEQEEGEEDENITIVLPRKPTPQYEDEAPKHSQVIYKSLESVLRARRLEFITGDLLAMGIEEFIDLAQLDPEKCKEPVWEILNYVDKKKLKSLVKEARDCAPGETNIDPHASFTPPDPDLPESPRSPSLTAAALAATAVASFNKRKSKEHFPINDSDDGEKEQKEEIIDENQQEVVNEEDDETQEQDDESNHKKDDETQEQDDESNHKKDDESNHKKDDESISRSEGQILSEEIIEVDEDEIDENMEEESEDDVTENTENEKPQDQEEEEPTTANDFDINNQEIEQVLPPVDVNDPEKEREARLKRLEKLEELARLERERIAAVASPSSSSSLKQQPPPIETDHDGVQSSIRMSMQGLNSPGASDEMKAKLQKRNQDQQKQDEHESNNDGPCSNFRLDLAATAYNSCKCGFPKKDHPLAGSSRDLPRSAFSQKKILPPISKQNEQETPLPTSAPPVTVTVSEKEKETSPPPPLPSRQESKPKIEAPQLPKQEEQQQQAPSIPKRDEEEQIPPTLPKRDEEEQIPPPLPKRDEEEQVEPTTTREKVIAFYTSHNPDKLADLDKILDRFKGREEVLFEKLKKKYLG